MVRETGGAVGNGRLRIEVSRSRVMFVVEGDCNEMVGREDAKDKEGKY